MSAKIIIILPELQTQGMPVHELANFIGSKMYLNFKRIAHQTKQKIAT